MVEDGVRLDGEDVATRLALLCLQADGRLTRSRAAAQAVRAGGLVDLVLAGRLVEEADAIDLLPGTGAGPGAGPVAEAVAAEVEEDPGRSLADLVERGRAGLREAAGDLRARGLWVPRDSPLPWRRDRHLPADPSLSRAALAPALAGPGERPAPGRAAAAVLAAVAGLLGGRFGDADERLLTACGPAEWVVRLAAETITVSRQWHDSLGRRTVGDLATPW